MASNSVNRARFASYKGAGVVANAARAANTVLPVITGTARVGFLLTSTTGTWTGSPAPSYSRQWRAAGVAISGATGATYTPVSADVGKAITVVVTAASQYGSPTATSAATAAVIAA